MANAIALTSLWSEKAINPSQAWPLRLSAPAQIPSDAIGLILIAYQSLVHTTKIIDTRLLLASPSNIIRERKFGWYCTVEHDRTKYDMQMTGYVVLKWMTHIVVTSCECTGKSTVVSEMFLMPLEQ